jgi:hypothetical protein
VPQLPRPGLSHQRVTRRSVLAASGLLGALVVTGCGSEEASPDAVSIDPIEPEAPDENLVDELSLIGAYLGVIEAFPELRGSLQAIADQHRAHARELGAGDDDLAAITPITPAAVRVKPALAELVAREQSAAALRAESAQRGQDTERVRALTYIAASESSHVPELRDIRRQA